MGKGDGKGGGKSAQAMISALGAQGCLPGGGKWTNDENTLFVGGLPPDTTPEHLYSIFGGFGAIAPGGAYVQTDPNTKQCKGIAFINFLEPSAATIAITSLNDAQLPWGQKLVVKVKTPPNPNAKGKGKGKGADGGLGA